MFYNYYNFFFEIFTFQNSLVWECLHTDMWHPKTLTSVRTSTLFYKSCSRKFTMLLIMDENSSLTRGVQSLVLNINESLQVKEWSAAARRSERSAWFVTSFTLLRLSPMAHVSCFSTDITVLTGECVHGTTEHCHATPYRLRYRPPTRALCCPVCLST